MNSDEVKKILLSVQDCDDDFVVIFSGKKSVRVNGLYKPETREIVIHNRNFKDDNALIYTAFHEYAHHIHFCQGKVASSRCHTAEFWAIFHSLLEKAETAGIYKIGAEECGELAEITKQIREKFIAANGRLMQEFGELLSKARSLCGENSIRFEDYIDRVLRIPRASALAIENVSAQRLDPSIGFENMKMISKMPKNASRDDAQSQILTGKSPAQVKTAFCAPKKPSAADEKTFLEREKARIGRAMEALEKRLQKVEEQLAKIEGQPLS